MKRLVYIVIGITVLFAALFVIYYSRKQSISPAKKSTIPKPSEQNNVNNSNLCELDSDCVLWICAGCLNKEWAKTAPPDLPCRTYSDYSGCKCVNRRCEEVK
jgi:hypothetical protein